MPFHKMWNAFNAVTDVYDCASWLRRFFLVKVARGVERSCELQFWTENMKRER